MPASFLESRQSLEYGAEKATQLCQPRFWNQGKAATQNGAHMDLLCQPRFWNQGKAATLELLSNDDYASLVFGIKAKLLRKTARIWINYASLVFGIKAKRRTRLSWAVNIMPASFLESRQS